MKSFAVVGGGIVGLATAHQLLLRAPDARVTLFEKEAGPARHQTGHNSGVLHCGLYYAPGSRKARLAVQGIQRMIAFCTENAIAFEQCGKTVIATSAEELPRLHALLERGQANGLKGLRLLDAAGVSELEPHAAGIAGIHVPQEGIVDYVAVAEALVARIQALGGRVLFSSKVTGVREGKPWTIETSAGEHSADFLINCGGLHADRIARLAKAADEARIVPFRGEYYTLAPERHSLVRNLIYPVPDPAFPFLGVHFTRLIHGGVEAGPNAVLALAREGYRKFDFNFRDFVETLTYRGFWRFFLRYPAMCWSELRRSFSRELFCRSLQRLVPEVQTSDLAHGGAGVRAQALAPTGELLQDFHLVRQAAALHVLNAPSPAATASLSIADEVLDQLADVLPC
jgi:(S)-2-hydroxyglutarate dehydrogenase